MKVIVGYKSDFIMLGMNHLKDDTSSFKTIQKLVTSLLRAHHVHGCKIPVMFMAWKPPMFAADTGHPKITKTYSSHQMISIIIIMIIIRRRMEHIVT